MRIEFQARAPNRRGIRGTHAAVAAIALAGSALLSGHRLLAPPFRVDPPALEFTGVLANVESPPKSLRIDNPDAADLRIGSLSMSGSMAAFQYFWNDCAGGVVPPRGSCHLAVVFQTGEVARQNASLRIVAASGAERTVQLSGIVSPSPPPAPPPPTLPPLPQAPPPAPPPAHSDAVPVAHAEPKKPPVVIAGSLTPDPIQFPVVQVGAGADQVAKIANTGNAPFHIVQTQIGGEHAGDFHVTDDSCTGRGLAPGACFIQVTFRPAEAGHHRAILTVTATDGIGPLSVALDGTATPPPVPVADLQPVRVDLTRQDFEHSIELRNLGDGNLVTRNISLGGRNPEDFSLDPRSCANATLARNQSCVMAVVFRADIARRSKHKTSEALVMVTDNAQGSPHTVVVTGTEGSNGHKKVWVGVITTAIVGGVAAYEATHNPTHDSGRDAPVKPSSDYPPAPVR